MKAGGVGLERGEQGEWNEFNVWTREAGSGQLAISVEGPSKAEIQFQDRKDGSCDVAYRVSEPGWLLTKNIAVYLRRVARDSHFFFFNFRRFRFIRKTIASCKQNINACACIYKTSFIFTWQCSKLKISSMFQTCYAVTKK